MPPAMTLPKPSLGLLCKLGSIAVHAGEFMSPNAHAYDREALLALLSDSEVCDFLHSMDEYALIPKMRK